MIQTHGEHPPHISNSWELIQEIFVLKSDETFGTWGLGGIFKIGSWASSRDCYSYKSNVRQLIEPMPWVGSWEEQFVLS